MEQVRRLRQQKGWTQAELAFHAGMGPTAVNQIETGRREPSAGSLRKLADALGVSIPDLFEGTDSGKASAPPLSFDESERRARVEDLAAHMSWRAGEIEREVADPDSPHFRDGEAVHRWSSSLNREYRVLSEYRDRLRQEPDEDAMVLDRAQVRLWRALEAGRTREAERDAWDREADDIRDKQPARPGIGGE